MQGELGAFAAAEDDFHKAEELLAITPDETALYTLLNSRGVSRVGQHDLEGAIADLKRAIALQPDEAAAHVNLAKAYQEQSRWPEALAELDRAIALQPKRMLAALYRTRSRLQQERGDWSAALADAQLALHHLDDKKHGQALEDWRRVGQLSLQCEKPADAVDAAEAMIAIDPKSRRPIACAAKGCSNKSILPRPPARSTFISFVPELPNESIKRPISPAPAREHLWGNTATPRTITRGFSTRILMTRLRWPDAVGSIWCSRRRKWRSAILSV